MHTHYDNLKVTRGAPAEVIRAAYKALSQRYHPDKNPSPDAQRIMRIINEAYTVLGDPDRRMAYDRELAAREQQTPKVPGPSASIRYGARLSRPDEKAWALG
jgi:DnaJ-class molecular chaperone